METTPLWARFALTLGFMAALLAVSIIPGRGEKRSNFLVRAVAATPPAMQKIAHLLLYAVLAFLWTWTLKSVESVGLTFVIALSLTAGFGAAMEYAQTFIPGRFGTLRDVAPNAVGAVAGLVAAALL